MARRAKQAKTGKRVNHAQLMLHISPTLISGLKAAAVEREMTYSALASEWLQKGLAEHEARKAAEK
jgi:hypothetical protein